MPSNNKKPILDFKVLTRKRDVIRIDDIDYEVVDLKELGLKQAANIQKTYQEILDVMKENDKDEYELAISILPKLDEIIRVLMPTLPQKTLELMPDMYKMQIIQAFFMSTQPEQVATTEQKTSAS